MNLLKLLLLVSSFTFIITSCSSDEDPLDNTPDEMEEMMDDPETLTGTIWDGASIKFTKDDNADPAEEANQDRITDNVWITRGITGGQIYNAKSESSSDKAGSPSGTEWALGKAADAATLTFANFRTTIKPKTVVGKDLVLHLIEDDIYIDVKFDTWTEGKAGGFSYTRSTEK